MFVILKLFYLCILTTLVTSQAPDCGIRNQFRGYCFSFESCDGHRCNKEECGYFRKSSVSLKIKETKIVPRCAVTNSTSLKSISGINSNIHVLASGSFANLPNLESILLPYNLIRELHHGIFYNVNVELIDLSWNKIIYISEGAFNGVTGLKYLNLSRNELSTVPVRHLPINLVDINLSYNFLKQIALYGANQPDLKFVDISHNNLEHVALSFDNVLKKLDLSSNHLNSIDFYDINDCENLKIPSNMFSEVPQFLIYSNIRRVALHPNPWKCDQLQQLWLHLQDNQIEEESPENAESQPLCASNTNLVSARLQNGVDLKSCEDDIHCSDALLCRSRQCSNPCPHACESTNICVVSNHKIDCLCPDTQKKNPQQLHSKCYDVECFSSTDCSYGEHCSSNKTCQRISFGMPSGASSSYGHNRPLAAEYEPYSGGFNKEGPESGGDTQYLPPANQGSSGYSAPRPPHISNLAEPVPSVAVSAYRPLVSGGGDNRVSFSEPWWFNEIPKLTPTNLKHNKN